MSISERLTDGRDGSSTREGAPALTADCLGYAEHGGEGECPLVIGFDFGTSTSKVVVHAPFVADGRHYLGRREDAPKEEADWLWPSALAVDGGGACALAVPGDCHLRTDLKVRLMDVAAGDEGRDRGRGAGAAVTAYLALMLRRVRARILEAHADDLRSFERLDWSLNLGIPSGNRPNRNWKGLKELFLAAARAAWRLSVSGRDVHLGDAGVAFGQAREADVMHEIEGASEIQVFPEVVAGALGYARSDARRPGLHLAVDVGASTMDACLFILLPEEEDAVDEWPLLEAEVERLGTAMLHERRIAAVRCVDEEEAERIRLSYDPLSAMAVVPDGCRGGLAALDAWNRANREMTRAVRGFIGGFVGQAASRRDTGSRSLQSGGEIPVVLMGGGSRAQFYRRAVRDTGEHVRSLLPSGHGGMPLLDAAVSRELDRSVAGMGYRLAVAAGLSEPSLNLPEYRDPEDVPDTRRKEPERRVRYFPDKDQV